ncbi:MAG: S1 RNA-binding domain-containing protein, partial [Bryobacterales bacterium]|nr:S1 RNA-binding domain-containing protein [Bryobacterales bacterium]
MNTEDHDLIASPQPAAEAVKPGGGLEPAEAPSAVEQAGEGEHSELSDAPGSSGSEAAAAEIRKAEGESIAAPATVVQSAPASTAGPAEAGDTHGLPGMPLPSLPEDEASEDDVNLQEELEAADEAGMSEMERLLDAHSQPASAGDGHVIAGRVLEIRETEVIVDISQKAEGSVPIEQVKDHLGNLQVAVGDTLDVVVVRGVDYTKEGYISLSHEKVSRLRAWDNLEKALKDDLPVLGRVLSRTKGGLTVDVGMKAFMPASHVDVRPVQNLDQFVGQDIPVKILKMNRRRSNVVVSRRAIVE